MMERAGLTSGQFLALKANSAPARMPVGQRTVTVAGKDRCAVAIDLVVRPTDRLQRWAAPDRILPVQARLCVSEQGPRMATWKIVWGPAWVWNGSA